MRRKGAARVEAKPQRAVTPAPSSAGEARALAVLLALVAFTYLSIHRPLSDGNTAARMALAVAIVERGSFEIFPSGPDRLLATEDWAKRDGHYYSNKAPGPSLIYVPVYVVQRWIQHAAGIPDSDLMARQVGCWIANLVASVVPSLVAVALLFAFLRRRMKLQPGLALALCATWALGSLALPYSVVFFGHQTSGAFFTAGFCLSALELDRSGGPSPRRMALAGVLQGMAVLSDYLSALLVAVWSIYLLWRARSNLRVLVPWVLGGLPFLVFIGWYNSVCFGSPLTSAYDLSLVNPKFASINAWEAPQLERLLDITVRPWRGIFYCTPVFLIMFIGLERLRALARETPELAVAAAGVVGYFVALAAFPSAFGGWCIGPRYYTPALSFSILLVAAGATLVPHVFYVLASLSAFLMLATSLTEVILRQDALDPLRQLVFPILAGKRPATSVNLFTWLGLDVRSALHAYLVVWATAAALIWWLLRPKRAAR